MIGKRRYKRSEGGSNFCNKFSGKFVFARGFGGYCGNEENPFRVLTQQIS